MIFLRRTHIPLDWDAVKSNVQQNSDQKKSGYLQQSLVDPGGDYAPLRDTRDDDFPSGFSVSTFITGNDGCLSLRS
jgi:hypothetical protein